VTTLELHTHTHTHTHTPRASIPTTEPSAEWQSSTGDGIVNLAYSFEKGIPSL
jgi:hypothetical protein